ncbi:DHA2 family efflux MFS transporter permease subunit [Tistrella bauzanensis]|uniref:DHA2 family efflux MFS transporter permease subunit n=1 Tax=Tistrella arctica TaxID=3133430 RepID=A0ABU9YJF8_9PROT
MSTSSGTTTSPAVTTAPPAAGGGADAASGPSRGEIAGFIAMVFGMFMAILDIQIVSSSLSELQAGLAASPDEVSWIQTSYLIAEVVMIPLSGYLSRALSTRGLFLISAAGFTLMSVACATATSLNEMIVWRALQGFLGGAMIPTVFAAAFQLFRGNRRGGVSVVIGLVATLAPTIGPTLGGWLTEVFSWHWLFLVNVVPGILVTLVVWRAPAFDTGDRSLLRRLDLAGLMLMAVFLGTMEYVVEEGPRDDWFDDRTIAVLFVIMVVAGIGFFWRVLSHHNPIVDLKAFRDRNFATGCMFSFVIGVGLYGLVYVLPLYLARIRDLNAMQIGEVLFVTGLAQFCSAPIAGMLSRKMDQRVMLAIGFTTLAGSTWWMSHITADWEFDQLLVPQILRGMSLMFCMLPINQIALGTLPMDMLKNASGLYNLMRNLGGAVGLAGINTLMIDRNAVHLGRIADSANPARPEVQAALDGLTQRFDGQVAGDASLAALKTLMGMVQQQATVMTFGDVFLVLAAIFIGAAMLTTTLRRPAMAGAPAGGGH